MQEVECLNTENKKVMVPIEKLSFRPSGYALVVRGGKVLLMRVKSTGKYFLPGGGLEIGEKVEDAVRREVKEEAGIIVKDLEFSFFNERFFYYDHEDLAWQVHAFVYKCKVESDQSSAGFVGDIYELNEKPIWVEIDTLTADDFHVTGEEIIKALKD
jgi:8-oxo-dGTP pyrophosphatase MutT (NUDIX family)